MRRHIKGRIGYRNPFGGNSHTTYACHLLAMSLLNGNVSTRGKAEINRGTGSNNIEWNGMGMRQHRDTIRANLVCNIPVGRNTVSAHKDGFDPTMPHEVPGHVVSNQRQWNTCLL